MIYEDIIHFENRKGSKTYTEQEIAEKARKIAVRMLQVKLDIVPENKNTIFLKDAIRNSLKIKKSEVAYG